MEEWQYAAMGGAQQDTYKYSGSTSVDRVAWYDGNSGKKAHPVGTRAANSIGLYDMSGNVREMTWDKNSYGHPAVGGDWADDAKLCEVNVSSTGRFARYMTGRNPMYSAFALCAVFLHLEALRAAVLALMAPMPLCLKPVTA